MQKTREDSSRGAGDSDEHLLKNMLTSAQAQIVTDKHRFRVVNCGRRFGKTTMAVEEMVACAVSADDKQVAYIAPTYQQARDIAWEMLKRKSLAAILTVNESRLEITLKTVKGGRSRLVLRGWESVETLRGQRFDFIVIDEVASMRNFLIGWQEVLRPTLTDTKGSALFISTPKGFNHFYDLFNMERDPERGQDYKSFHFTSYDNHFVPPEEIDKARQEMTEDRFAQEYLADFRKVEGLVYKEFDRQKHIYVDEQLVLNPIETIAGVDFGTTNPAAVIKIVRDYDNKFWVTKEWYQSGMTDAVVAELVAAEGFNKVYPDPESASAIKELRQRGVNIREVIKGKDSVKNGINKVRELLKAGRLMIHESCTNLIWEFETYIYPDKKDMRNLDENPIKENDHALDALRYAIMMQTEGAHQQAKQFVPPTYKYNNFSPR